MNKYTKYTETVFHDSNRYDILVEPAVFGTVVSYETWRVVVYKAFSRRKSGRAFGMEARSCTAKTWREGLAAGREMVLSPKAHRETPAPKRRARLVVTASQYFGSGTVMVHWTQTDDDLSGHIEARDWAYKNIVARERNGFYEFGVVDAEEFRARFPATHVGTGSCQGWDYESPVLPGVEAPSLKRCKAALAAGCTTVSGAWEF